MRHVLTSPDRVILIRGAAARTQVVVVSHSAALTEHLGPERALIELTKRDGATVVAGQGLLDAPAWHWGSR